MWVWKAYFLFVVISETYSIFNFGSIRIWEMIDLPITVLSCVGLFCFCWKKSILKPIFWRIFLPILVIWDLFYLFIIPLPAQYIGTIPQTFAAVLMCILDAPLIVALYLYAFNKADKPQSSESQKKKVPAGIKVISVYFILLIVLPFLTHAMISATKQAALHASRETKIKAIQTAKYKKLNIKTVDEYDKYWASKKSLGPTPTVRKEWAFVLSLIIIFVSLYGMWNLKNWGRLGIMTFTIFRLCQEILTYRFFRVPQGHMLGGVISLVIYVSIIYYLKRPEVKKLFESV